MCGALAMLPTAGRASSTGISAAEAAKPASPAPGIVATKTAAATSAVPTTAASGIQDAAQQHAGPETTAASPSARTPAAAPQQQQHKKDSRQDQRPGNRILWRTP